MRFTIPRDIYYGRNSLDALKELKGKRAAVITGGTSMQKNGFLDQVLARLKDAGLKTEVYEGVEQDPSVGTVRKGADFLKKAKPDWIVALGGGSPLDAAKAMWVFYEHPELTFDEVNEGGRIPPLRQKARFVAIPSTSGTASEVTAFSVITDETTGIKYPLADYEMTPDMAILDPLLAETMPPKLTAQTGMDALTHAIETYVAKGHSEFTDPLALHSITLIFGNLVKSYQGDMEAREKLHYAQCLAGMAFTNALLGIAHSMAHKTGQVFHLPHGLANAIYLPYVIQYNAGEPETCRRYADIARAIGVEGSSDRELTQKLVEFIRTLSNAMEIPRSLKEYGVEENDFRLRVDELSSQAALDPCTISNPRKTGKDEIKKLFHMVYEGGYKEF